MTTQGPDQPDLSGLFPRPEGGTVIQLTPDTALVAAKDGAGGLQICTRVPVGDMTCTTNADGLTTCAQGTEVVCTRVPDEVIAVIKGIIDALPL